ncbi:MAG: nicotinate-nucleotide adenylyltransferase [Pyrinomonadaceae bacterium]|jgi:nicotinate-nucleotide adenylyltransferase|nr:nicotinate-nucleotide adenylyltransferase [Pyrinomonadaceae bacterium]
MDQRKRIAIYGGTFDPVHLGHLEIGRRVSQFFVIDEFLFMPARVAPHKVGQEAASALDRYAMLALATQDEPRLSVSRFELDGPGQQYTVDTLAHFRASCSELDELFFVMGADSWAEITTWREWQRLVTLANLIVVTRPGHQTFIEDFAGAASQIVDLRGENDPATFEPVEVEALKIFVTDAVMMDVSATAVRRAARADDEEELKRLVPPSVADYIRKYGLYRNTNEA